MGDDAPAPPDYSGLVSASMYNANVSRETSQAQLAWAREQYDRNTKMLQPVIDDSLARAKVNDANAAADRARYQSLYQPLENDAIYDAQLYSSQAKQDEMAGKAAAQVSSSFGQSRAASQARLQSFGIDPSQMRSGALDTESRLAEASARASAATTARQQTEAMGRAMRDNAINVGKGYPGQVQGSYGTAIQSGSQAASTALNNTQTAANAMNQAATWMGQSNQALSNGANMLNMGYQNALGEFNANQNASSGIMGLLGTGAGALLGLSDERAKDDHGVVGETHDGQAIHLFNYKGDSEPRMGLMAQEVEERDPGAVHELPGGMKAVDYNRALPVREDGRPAAGRELRAEDSPSRGHVQDDIDAYLDTDQGKAPFKLNKGEFVLPADYVAAIGTDKLERDIQKVRERRTGQKGPAVRPRVEGGNDNGQALPAMAMRG